MSGNSHNMRTTARQAYQDFCYCDSHKLVTVSMRMLSFLILRYPDFVRRTANTAEKTRLQAAAARANLSSFTNQLNLTVGIVEDGVLPQTIDFQLLLVYHRFLLLIHKKIIRPNYLLNLYGGKSKTCSLLYST